MLSGRRKSLEFVTASASAPTLRSDASRGPELEKVLSGVPEPAWDRDADIKAHPHGTDKRWLTLLKLTFGSIGVVYGDIGTSPLYVLSSTFLFGQPSEDDIVGVVSLVIWTLTSLLAIKYTLIVLHADDNGQGGTFALYSLLKRQAEEGKARSDRKLSQYTMGPKRTRTWLQDGNTPGMLSRSGHGRKDGVRTADGDEPDWKQRFVQAKWLQTTISAFVVVGVGMILGDGVLTPAMSVVSACEGLLITIPTMTRMHLVALSMAILFILFMIQRYGTGRVGVIFSPVILLWFAALFGIGIYNIAVYDWRILRAIGPNAWLMFMIKNGHRGWLMLGGVVLCITGAEALYADLGHFSVHSIQLSCLTLTYPVICIAYLGQGAYLLRNPQDYGAAFWKSIPTQLFWPVFIISTLATVVASQALISAAFQIVQQAINQGFFPRFHIYHTSRKHAGQIYIPFVNYLLMILCLIVVGAFQTSERIGKAYGIAVLADMLLTTHFMALVMMTVWKIPIILPLIFYVVFAAIEATYWTATLVKVPEGGWFALMMAFLYAFIMVVWSWGSGKKKAYFAGSAVKIEQLLALHDGVDIQTSMTLPQQKVTLQTNQARLHRMKGIGVFYSENAKGVPPVLSLQVSRLPVLFEVNIFLTIRFVPIPEVKPIERLLVEQLGVKGFYHVVARYGYLEKVQQGEGFMSVVLEHVIALLYRAVAQRVDASEALRRAFNVPNDERIAGRHGSEVHLPALEDDDNLPPGSVPRSDEDGLGPGPMKLDDEVRVDIMAPDLSRVTVSAAAVELDANLSMPPDKRALLKNIVQKIIRGESNVPMDHRKVRTIAEELAQIESARMRKNVVYVLGTSHAGSINKRNWIRSMLTETFLAIPYRFILRNFGQDAARAFGIPDDQLLEIGLIYNL